MTTTTNFGMTLLEASQAQKEITINEGLTCIDALLLGTVVDKDLATPPGSPATNALYIVAASPTGAWSGQAKSLAYYNQVWNFITPVANTRVWVNDESLYYQYNGTAWSSSGGGGGGSGDMLKANYDPASVNQQMVGTTAAQTITNKTISGAANTLTVRLANDVSGTLPVASGGTGQTTYTNGQLLIGNTTGSTLSKATLTAGTGIAITNGAGAITIATSGVGDMLKATYDAASINQQVVGTTATQTITNKTISGTSNTLSVRLANDVSGTLPVASGGTGQTTYTNGQLLIGNTTGSTLSKATLTAGTGISITNGAGAITIAATGGGGGGDMLAATYDPAAIAQQVVGTTATQTVTNKTISGASNTLTVRLANDVTGTLPVASGGTGQTTYTNGQLLIGNTTGNTLSKATLTAGTGISITNGGGAITIAATGTVGGTAITNSLSSNVSLSNTANYFDGPSVAQGTSGTWFVSGQVMLIDTAGSAAFYAKLWDGTTVIATVAISAAQNNYVILPLSGCITNPAGNLRISVRDSSSTSGSVIYNASGSSKDATITAIRIA